MTTPSKAALRAELEAALASYRGPVKQCPAAAPPELVVEEELELFDDEDEAEEDMRFRKARKNVRDELREVDDLTRLLQAATERLKKLNEPAGSGPQGLNSNQ